ncbi:NUDIX hydrolase [Candidatus Dojkabacteria bacterium]|nr:NUDIX hydrolase [Candidatus Dojkabacteria bacterium]
MYYNRFKFCPVCGTKYKTNDFDTEAVLFQCKKCNFSFYQNMVPTNSTIIPKSDEPLTVLLTQRNMDPHKGKFDLPGGFFKFGEEIEKGVLRELEEELVFKPKLAKLFGIEINDYNYKGDDFKHTTIYYITEPISRLPEIADKKENSGAVFFGLENLEKEHDKFAFEADYRILQKYRAALS